MEETQSFVSTVQQSFVDNGTWDMASLENGLREALLRDGCRILEALLNQPNALGALEHKGQLHDYRTRTVHCLLGTFQLNRGYYHFSQGNDCPMDSMLGLINSYSPGLAKLMCMAAGTDGSYDEGEKTLGIYAGVHVPASQIRKMTQQIGPDLQEWSLCRYEPRCHKVPTLYISYDGTGVPMRKEETAGRKGKQADGSSGSREVKLGCVFSSTSVDEDGKPIRDHDSTTYLASFKPAEDFGLLLLQEARLRGLGEAQRSVVLGDGAHWIWNQADINFPQAIQILDYYHAQEHLSVLAAALFPDAQEAEKHLTKWKSWLDQDNVLKIVDYADKKKARNGERRKTALREIEYLRKNAHRMRYASFQNMRLFIGSGVVEAGCKTVVGKRTKQSGMFWNVPGAQNVLDIRCSILSNTYDDYWKFRKKRINRQYNIAA